MIVPYAGFLGGSYNGGSPRVAVEQCLNMIPEVAPPTAHAKAPLAFRRTPGLLAFGTATSGPGRASFYQDGRFFIVSGTQFCEVASNGTVTVIGTVASSLLPTKIASSGVEGHQLCIISGGMGYIYDLVSGAFVQITDADFPTGVVSVDYSDGYFIVAVFDSMGAFYSGLFDGLSWDAGDQMVKSQTTDNVRAAIVSHKETWLMGSKTIEVWGNTGDDLVTFAPVPGVLIEHGIGPIASVTKVANTIAWMGSDEAGDRIVYIAKGYSAVQISTPEIDQRLKALSWVDDAIGMSYRTPSGEFYVLTFPTANLTLAYSFTTGFWHELAYLNPATGAIEAHLASCHAFAFGKHIVSSRVDGALYEMTLDAKDDAGTAILRRRRAPHIASAQRSIEISCFAVDVDAGQAEATGQGSNPQLQMRYSTDGGMTWSDTLFASTGKVGEYDTRCEYRRLGQGANWVFEISSTEPTEHNWLGASIDAEGLAA